MPHPPQIPLTPQTDERNFPRWDSGAGPNKSGYAYPKMLTRICTEDDREEWLKRHQRRDQTTGQYYYESVPPLVGSIIPIMTTPGMVTDKLARAAFEPVIVNDAEEEKRILAWLHPEAAPEEKPQTVEIPIAAAPQPVKKRGRPPRQRQEAVAAE